MEILSWPRRRDRAGCHQVIPNVGGFDVLENMNLHFVRKRRRGTRGVTVAGGKGTGEKVREDDSRASATDSKTGVGGRLNRFEVWWKKTDGICGYGWSG